MPEKPSHILSLLYLGDIFGKSGRKTVHHFLPQLKKEYAPDIILANAENIADGSGVTEETLQEMLDAGISGFSSGNHVFSKKQFIPHLENSHYSIVIPANYPPGVRGRRQMDIDTPNGKPALLINIIGRVFMSELTDCPFRAVDAILRKNNRDDYSAIIVDFHAEATSEKIAMAHHLDGRVDLLVGTHTHVPTADQRILERGMGYVTDLGMTGPFKDSIIGADKENVLYYFLTATKIKRWENGRSDTCLNAIYVEIDTEKRATTRIERVDRTLPVEYL